MLDYKESWALKNWCFWTVVLKKTLESLLDCKEIPSVNPKGSQSWIFIGRIDAEAEAPVSGSLLWLPVEKNWLIGKDPDAGKDWRQEEKGTTEKWDGWMASPTQWTWVWANFGSWWWTGNPGMLWSMGLQRVGRNWVTELNWWKGTLAYAIASVLEWFISGGSDDKESACNAGDLDLTPGLGRSPGGRHGNLLQYSCLQNPMDRGTYSATVHGVTKSWTWLNE